MRFFVAQVIGPNPCEGVEVGSLKWWLGCWMWQVDITALIVSALVGVLCAWMLRDLWLIVRHEA